MEFLDNQNNEKKIQLDCNMGVWPVPKKTGNNVFNSIVDADQFNKIVGTPENWPTILNDAELFNCWILPKAILYFSKPWFDRVKFKDSIRSGIPFPLFEHEDKKYALLKGKKIEDTAAGRATIARIIIKTAYALRTYLKGNWYSETVPFKSPGGYIINSIKNDLVQKIGVELGFKQHAELVCPYCLSRKEKGSKSLLTEYDSNVFGCDRCSDRLKGLSGEVFKGQKKVLSTFGRFIGTTCVCISDSCPGKFIPVNFIKRELSFVKEQLKGYHIKGTGIFKMPPSSLLSAEIQCPFCNVEFVISDAIQKAQGHKNKSGYFTGVPKTLVWDKIERATLDNAISSDINAISFKDNLVGEQFEPDIDIAKKEKINLLIGDVMLKMLKLNKNLISGLTSWYFYSAAIEWMLKHYNDAYKYFFCWETGERDSTALELIKSPGQKKKKITDIIRGQEIAIHQSFFYEWVRVIEENIGEFTKLNKRIQTINDLKWFCRAPVFPEGPVATLSLIVGEKKEILNTTEYDQIKKPRFVKIYSILKENEYKEYIEDVDFLEWHTIKLNEDSDLQEGDVVVVKALMMPGHPAHAPIQRILRFRSLTMNAFVVRIREEEKTGISDPVFWTHWKKQVVLAKKALGVKE
jgi:hypothetical protein